jgi:hypothetical protein
MLIKLDYTRGPVVAGESGYGVSVTVDGKQVTANLPLQFHPEMTINYSVRQILGKFIGARDSLLAPATPPTPVTGPPSQTRP